MATVTPNILRAGAAQAARLSQIAIAAKSYWGYPAQWIELWHNQLTIAPAYVARSEVWAAEVDSTILGFYALGGTAPRLTLEHLWVMPVAIRQGIGSALMRHALARAEASGADSLEIESDPNAEGFYAKMGAETVGEVGYVLEGQRRTLPLMRITLPSSAAQSSAGS
jgi:GNAT superfamily N-acetyltransferase